jgi:hypothetical protein
VTAVGVIGGGATCSADENCFSGFCLEGETRICFEACDPLDGSSECAAGSCLAATFVVDERDPDDLEDDLTDQLYICQ